MPRKRANGTGRTQSNGPTPSGSTAHFVPGNSDFTIQFASGYKWNIAFTLDLNDMGIGTFSAGQTEEYAKTATTVYNVATWKGREYTFYDTDWTQNKYFVTIVR